MFIHGIFYPVYQSINPPSDARFETTASTARYSDLPNPAVSMRKARYGIRAQDAAS